MRHSRRGAVQLHRLLGASLTDGHSTQRFHDNFECGSGMLQEPEAWLRPLSRPRLETSGEAFLIGVRDKGLFACCCCRWPGWPLPLRPDPVPPGRDIGPDWERGGLRRPPPPASLIAKTLR